MLRLVHKLAVEDYGRRLMVALVVALVLLAVDVSSWRGEVSLLRYMRALHAPPDLIAQEAARVSATRVAMFLSVPLRFLGMYLAWPFLKRVNRQTGTLRQLGYAFLGTLLLFGGVAYGDNVARMLVR